MTWFLQTHARRGWLAIWYARHRGQGQHDGRRHRAEEHYGHRECRLGQEPGRRWEAKGSQ
jgi:hypothetical protein